MRRFFGVLLLSSSSTLLAATSPQAALTTALTTTPAVGVVVDVATGNELAHTGKLTTRSTPGSILKPLFMTAALKRGYVRPQTAVFCRRDLPVEDAHRSWNLACTHPQSNVAFAAMEALAYSCNRYFADLADRIPPEQTEGILRHYGLTQTVAPQTPEQKELLVLGVAGIVVTPAQIAVAYRRLARDMEDDPALQPVRAGLKDSVIYGMAHNAAVPGREILGKTGTANAVANGPSHGWFAGISQLNHRAVIVVIYLPRGSGGDAARLGQRFFAAASATP